MRSIWPVWQIRASLTPDAVRKSHSVNNRARPRKDDAVEIGWLMMQIEGTKSMPGVSLAISTDTIPRTHPLVMSEFEFLVPTQRRQDRG
jgi:hypothetical protein